MPLELFHHVAETIANVLVTTPPPTLAELNASVDLSQLEKHNACFNHSTIYKQLVDLLHREDFPNLLAGYQEMNKAGRQKYLAEEPEDKAKGVVVCASIPDTKKH